MDEISPTKIGIWILAIRPKTLPAAIGPVLVGTAFAWHDNKFNFFIAFAALLGALVLQIAANLANDYSDFKKGTDPDNRVGPIRVAASGLMSEKELLQGLIVTILISLLIGFYLIWIVGIIVFWIGIFSIIALLTYSGSVIAFGYRALGDLVVFIFFGFVAVMGSYYVQTENLTNIVFIGSLPAGCLITAILVVNNYRDIDTDKATNKTTLAVLLGPKGSRIEYVILMLVAFSVPFVLFFFFSFSYWVFLPIISLPLAYKNINAILSIDRGTKLNTTLTETAKLGLIFNLLFSLGIII